MSKLTIVNYSTPSPVLYFNQNIENYFRIKGSHKKFKINRKEEFMEQSKNISNTVKINFYLNIFNFILFSIVTITGLLIQIKYHMHALPDYYAIWGLNRPDWQLLHKISASVFLAGLAAHCLMHRKFISAVSGKIFQRRSVSPASVSYSLFVISIPTCLITLISWIFLTNENPSRFVLVEIHDKIALFWFVLSSIHIISRTGQIMKTFRKLL